MFVGVFQIFLLHTPSHLESKCTSQYYDCAHATTRGYLWHDQRWVRISQKGTAETLWEVAEDIPHHARTIQKMSCRKWGTSIDIVKWDMRMRLLNT